MESVVSRYNSSLVTAALVTDTNRRKDQLSRTIMEERMSGTGTTATNRAVYTFDAYDITHNSRQISISSTKAHGSKVPNAQHLLNVAADVGDKAISYEGYQSVEELKVLKTIVAREDGLDQLLQYCCSFEEDCSVELLETLLKVRELSLSVIDAIAGWRRRMAKIEPFPWRNMNYLLKMNCDLDFLNRSQLATKAMDGVRLTKRNPFSTIGGLDQSMSMFWQHELPEDDDLPVLLDSTSFSASVSVDLPSKIRLAECFLLREEQRFGKLTKVQAAADHRMKSLVQQEAIFASKARSGRVKGDNNDVSL